MSIVDLASADFTDHGEPADVSIQAPVVAGAAVELATDSRIFRKQVLKTGQIDYKGNRLDFTPDYLDGLATAFREGAFDSVPLVFAGADNAHTQDVTRIRGEVLGFERDGDRLDAVVRASNDEAAALLRENPNIGVSVRIEQPIQRADGKRWPAAVQHVLATANPRVTGMTPWQPVDLAADDRTVLDLSAFDFADGEDPITDTEEIAMADTPSAFTAEETEQLRGLLTLLNAEEGEPEGDDPDEQTEQLFDDDTETESETPAEPAVETRQAPAEASLSRDDTQSIELAAQVEAQNVELSKLRAERDTERYEKLRDRFTREFGVPPAITDLARPLLEGSHAVELANGDAVDAADIVAQVITELAKARLVDLSAETVYDADAATRSEASDKARADEMASYAAQYGL